MAAVSAPPHTRRQLRAYSHLSLWLMGFCFVLSGATGLIYEVLWARMLGLVFGATTFAISAVLAAFMGGLALGSALAGKLAARIKRPLRAYGIIEIGIAVYAIAVPLLFRLIDYFYAFIWEQFHPGFYSFSLWRFVLSCLVLLVPTTLMGATLPVLSAALLRSPDNKQTAVTRLYTCNLIGAIIGTVVAGFFLLPIFGVRLTIYTAAAINLMVGLAAILIDRLDEKSPAQERAIEQAIVRVEEDERIDAAIKLELTTQHEGSTRFWLLCAAISGFVTISTQVAWTRVLTMIIGSSTYAFSIVVALFLLGLAAGAYSVARKKIAANLPRSIMNVEIGIAVTLLVSIWMTNATPNLLIELGTRLEISSWLGLLMLQMLIAALLILFPAILMGMVMPLVLVWASKAGGDSSVRQVGRSYAINTLGAIAGAFSTGFILIPKMSTRFTVLFAASLCIILAGLAYIHTRERERAGGDQDLRRSLTVGATAALIVLLFLIAPKMKLADLSIGAYDSLVRVLAKSRGSVNESASVMPGPDTHRLLWYKEGPTATVSVRDDWGIRSMAVNGRTNASDRDDMPTQVILGQLPILIAPRAATGLIVGYGSGVSVGSMLQSEIKSLECVELEPTAIEAGKYFNHVNNQPLNDPRLHVIIDDARTYLRVNATQYDMIVSEPSHPWVPGVANLFTQEFFGLGLSRLKEDGVFVQWVQIYQLSNESLRSVLATYKSVFQHVLVFRVEGAAKGKDLILVGSRQPLTLEHVGERMQTERVMKELSRININAPADLEAWFVCDETQLAPAVDGAIINTDDNMRVENRAPREAFLPVMKANEAWIETLAQQSRKARNLTVY
jgi:spermidine synthase